jgi:hypothetical protein
MSVCYILRGNVGSGKSTLAEILARDAINQGLTSAICCADDYFMWDGEYRFDASKLGQVHKLCREKFAYSIGDGIDVLIVANTSTTISECDYYYKLAQENNYFVQILTVGEFNDAAIERYVLSNTHNVSRETIQKMAKRFTLL